MKNIFAVYFIDEPNIVGVYSSLDLAIQYGHSLFDNKNAEWCVIEKTLDATPDRLFNNVYQNTYRVRKNDVEHIVTQAEYEADFK